MLYLTRSPPSGMYLSLMTVCLHFSIEFLAWISYTFTLDNESALAVYYIVMGVLCMIVTVIEVNILYPYLLTPRYSSFIQLFGIFAVFLVKFIPIIFTSNYFIDDKKKLTAKGEPCPNIRYPLGYRCCIGSGNLHYSSSRPCSLQGM